MDVTRMLEADHREVEQLLGQIDRADGAERGPMVNQVATSLRAHMELEEAVVYPELRPIIGADEVEEADNEHTIIRANLEQFVALGHDEPGFGAALDALRAAVGHHVKDEEDEVFPTARREGSDVLATMATAFMTKRLDLGMPIEADALSDAATKDELADEARAAGLDVSGSMTKAELADVLAQHMAS